MEKVNGNIVKTFGVICGKAEKTAGRKKKIMSVPTILLYEIDPQKRSRLKLLCLALKIKSETGKKKRSTRKLLPLYVEWNLLGGLYSGSELGEKCL